MNKLTSGKNTREQRKYFSDLNHVPFKINIMTGKKTFLLSRKLE